MKKFGIFMASLLAVLCLASCGNRPSARLLKKYACIGESVSWNAEEFSGMIKDVSFDEASSVLTVIVECQKDKEWEYTSILQRTSVSSSSFKIKNHAKNGSGFLGSKKDKDLDMEATTYTNWTWKSAPLKQAVELTITFTLTDDLKEVYEDKFLYFEFDFRGASSGVDVLLVER